MMYGVLTFVVFMYGVSGCWTVIDLTQDNGEQQDLHKAITASLQDNQGILGGQVTREEQDISRSVVPLWVILPVIVCVSVGRLCQCVVRQRVYLLSNCISV